MARSEIRVRPLSRLDIAAISRIHADACQIAYRFIGWNYTLADVQSWYACKYPQWDWGRVALKGGTSVGFITMTSGLVDQLFVHPDAQRQGVGSALLKLALRRGIRPVTLHVFEKNTSARRFYERSGFKEADRWFNEQDQAEELLYQLK
jgi:GNAT superfamily N-acetyltransferase